MKLCVSIPTYNRKIQLERTLKMLEKQTRQDFCVVIYDNHSDYDINDLIESLSLKFRERITIYSNRYNIGMCGNIAKLFERSNAEWTWFLSDDDLPNEKAVEIILSDIEKYTSKEISIIQYPHFEVSKSISPERSVVDGLEGYVEYFMGFLRNGKCLSDVEGTLIYLSNKVYRIESFAKYIRFAYDYCNTGIPQLIPVLKALDDKQIHMLLHNISIVVPDSKGDRSWSVRNVALGMSTICNMPLRIDEETKRKLWYLLMIRFKLVFECYLKDGIHDYYYLYALYNNVYKYILSSNHLKYYEMVLQHAYEGTEIEFLRKTFPGEL